MRNEEYKKILFEIFETFGFSEEEKVLALNDFKQKLALELLMATKDGLPKENQEWISAHMTSIDRNDPKIREVQDVIRATYPPDTLKEKTRAVFQKTASRYIDFMSRQLGTSEEQKMALKKLIEKL